MKARYPQAMADPAAQGEPAGPPGSRDASPATSAPDGFADLFSQLREACHLVPRQVMFACPRRAHWPHRSQSAVPAQPRRCHIVVVRCTTMSHRRGQTAMPVSSFLILNGRARYATVSVVPQSLRRAAVAPDTGSAAPSYCMDAAFMSFWQHGCGNHAVWPGAGVAGVTEVCFRCAPGRRRGGSGPKINLS
jgi:hypothetical protein